MTRYFKNKALILPDIHAPFQHKKLFNNVIELIKDTKPNKIILTGDFLDCFSLSRFDKAKSRAEDFYYELTTAMQLLKLLRTAAPDASIIIVEGNHEARLKKLLDGDLKAFRSLPELKLENLLKLHLYDIKYITDFYKLNKNFICTHGFSCAKQSAKNELEKYGVSGVSGHVHRYNTFKKNYDERLIKQPLQWYSLGTLADINQLDYAKQFRSNWCNTFAFIEYDTKGHYAHIIHANKKSGAFYCSLNGRYYA